MPNHGTHWHTPTGANFLSNSLLATYLVTTSSPVIIIESASIVITDLLVSVSLPEQHRKLSVHPGGLPCQSRSWRSKGTEVAKFELVP